METEINTSVLESTDTLKTIYERRAVRRYQDRPVANEIIEKIIDAGRMAPSAMNKQAWKFYVLTSRDTIRDFSKEIAKVVADAVLKSGPLGIIKLAAGAISALHIGDLLTGIDPVFYGAPVVIFITAPADNEWAALDVGMCAQNMMLAAKSFGLDTCPLGVGKYVEHTKIFYRLQIPYPEKVQLAIVLGYGNEDTDAHKRVRNNVVYIDKKEKSMFKKALML